MSKEYPSIEEIIELILKDEPVEDKILVDDIEILIPESSERKKIKFLRCDFENNKLIIKNNKLNKNTSVDFISCTFKKNTFNLNLQNTPYLSFRNSNIYNETNLYLEVNNCNIRFYNTSLSGSIHGFLSEGSHLNFNSVNKTSKKQTGKLDIGFVDSYEINDCIVEELKIGLSKTKHKCSIKNINCNSIIINKSEHLGELSLEQSKSIDNLHIINSSFESITSFQNTTVNTIKLDKVQFNSLTYFDDFKILEPTKCDKITYRIIKQELQKTENRIDYDTYRSYELEAYKKELKETEKWYHGDLLILQLNNLFSKHGVNWKRAIGITILYSLGFYTILYIIKNFQNDFDITINGFDNFTSGYFKFFLITNFYDPLATEKGKFIETFAEWIPFIFGKIIIGYGLFETVQSFRKYKK